jgi:hypothetical protein
MAACSAELPDDVVGKRALECRDPAACYQRAGIEHFKDLSFLFLADERSCDRNRRRGPWGHSSLPEPGRVGVFPV